MRAGRAVSAMTLALCAFHGRMKAQTHHSPDARLQEIAWRYAPMFVQEVSPGSNTARFDHLMKFDFDGNYKAIDNDANAYNFGTNPRNRRPAVYYSIVETDDSFYLGYYFYHPADAGTPYCIRRTDCDGHPNDLEAYWVHVDKATQMETVSLTNAHGAMIPSYNHTYYSTPGGPTVYYYAANTFSTAEHGGTHLDAPVHFSKDAHAVDAIPLDQLIGAAVVVDITAKCTADADYRVTVADLQAFEQAHGPIPDRAILLIRTGFSARWPDAARYLGTGERGQAAVAKLHFPGLHPDAAAWLVANRKIAALGVDTASIDYGQSTAFESHRTLYERNIPAFENLASLDRLPPTGAYVVALPMKIRGGSGAPLRAIALLPR